MNRWWLVVNGIAGAWLIAMGVFEFGFFDKFAVTEVDGWFRPACCCIAGISAFMAAKNQSMFWFGVFLALMILLNPIVPMAWDKGWNKSFDCQKVFDITAGGLCLYFAWWWWK